jgi:hypothetical protein
MPTFTPDKNTRTKIIALLTLWGKNLDQKHHHHGKLHKSKLKTRYMIQMMNNLPGAPITFDILKKYWENDSVIQSRIADLNKDTVTYNTGEQDQVPETEPIEEPVASEVPAEPEMAEPEPQPEPEPMPQPAAPEQPEDTLPGSRSIVAQMAKRAKGRAMR